MRGKPFGRAMAMAQAIAFAMASASHLQPGLLQAIGPYESRGKGLGRSNRTLPGHKTARRVALKLRNKKARHG